MLCDCDCERPGEPVCLIDIPNFFLYGLGFYFEFTFRGSSNKQISATTVETLNVAFVIVMILTLVITASAIQTRLD